jgi:hypothetical protein
MKLAFFVLEFPPVNTTGNYRSAGFVRYLLSKDVDVLVFTCTIDSGEQTFGKKADFILMQGLEKARIFRYNIKPFKKIWRTKLGNAIRIWWNTTDKIDKRWFTGKTQEEILQTLKIEKPDFLYFSMPPFSTARMALKVHKATDIPLIVDMRDAWSLWGTSPHQTFFHYWQKKKTEQLLFAKAQDILGVTPELVLDFQEQHPTVSKEKFKVIYNGVDDFGTTNLSVEDPDIFKIGYVGSFYYSPDAEIENAKKWYQKKIRNMLQYFPRSEQWIYRSPYFCLKALAELVANEPEFTQKIRFEFIGLAPNWFLAMINDFNLNDIFVNHGFKSKQEVLRIQSSWNAILATSEKVVNGNHFCLPSKIFDAVESKKRIFAFVTDGSQKSFLKDYPQTVFFEPDEIKINSEKLGEIINSKLEFPAKSLDKFYSREHQSEVFFGLLNSHKN